METMKITGKGRISVKPDKIRLNMTMEESYKEYEVTLSQSSNTTKILKDLFVSFGFQKDDLKTNSFGIDSKYESYKAKDQSWKKRLVGYTYTHRMLIEFDADNRKLGEILYALAHSVITPEISIEYTMSDPEKYKDELLKNAIEDSKNNNIDKLITGLGIKNVGKQSAKVLAENFADMDEVANANYDQLINLPDFGDTMVNDIIKYFRSEKYHTIISKLKEYGVNVVSKSSEIKSDDNRFEGMTFVITGTLPTMKRDEASSLIQSFGGKVSGSVSKKTSYVLAGEEAGSKLTKAETLGIRIIDEEEFKSMIK